MLQSIAHKDRLQQFWHLKDWQRLTTRQQLNGPIGQVHG